MKIEKELEDLLLQAPETQMDSSLMEDIKGWNSNPTALNILYVLDKIVCFSLASEFVVNIFEMLLEQAIFDEKTTLEELKQNRDWDLLSPKK